MLKDSEIDDMIESEGLLKGLNPTLGISAFAMIIIFIVFTVLLGEDANNIFFGMKDWIEQTLGWYYIAVMMIAFGVCMFAMFSKAGKSD